MLLINILPHIVILSFGNYGAARRRGYPHQNLSVNYALLLYSSHRILLFRIGELQVLQLATGTKCLPAATQTVVSMRQDSAKGISLK